MITLKIAHPSICTPGAPLRYFNDGVGGGDPTEVHIYAQNNPNFRNCLSKKIPTFLVHPKNPTQAVNCTVIVDLSWRKLQYPKKIPGLL